MFCSVKVSYFVEKQNAATVKIAWGTERLYFLKNGYLCEVIANITYGREMIRSMTGYGKGEAVCGEKKIIVELRSLNSKQIDLSLKLPSIYRHAEQDLRTIISKALVRGKVDVYVCFGSTVEDVGATINDDVFTGYFRHIKRLVEANGAQWDSNATVQAMQSILRLPDVVGTNVDDVTDEERKALMKACRLAVSQMESFRRQEGEVLFADILGRVDIIRELLAQVKPYEAARVENVRARILDGIESMALQVDTNRLEQELIYYVEKFDITEEKVRLANHCAYFREVAEEEQENGRKLGFIAQEMGREINTLGSKANDVGIQRIVVQMKDELEKIKEQSMNIL